MKNTISIYPSGIDQRVFFSDISIEQTDIMNQYQQLLKEGKYSEASRLLNDSEVSFYGAWLLNYMGNQLHQIGEYLLTKERKEICVYQDEEPEDNLVNGMVWIGN